MPLETPRPSPASGAPSSDTLMAGAGATLLLSASIEGESRAWPLDAASIGIGRSSRNAVHLPDPTVSKEHALIERTPGGWQVRDLGSRNGTRVNGVEATQALPLKDGDRLEVGNVLMRVGGDPAQSVMLSPGEGLGSSVRLRVQDVLGRPTPITGIRSQSLVHLLAEAGRVLVLPRPLPETCEEILTFVEKAVPSSRLLLLLRLREGEDPVPIARRDRGSRPDQPLAISRTIMDFVLNECTAVTTNDAQSDERFREQLSIVAQSIHSAMAVPLFDNEKVLGLLYADSLDPTVQFGQQELEVFTLLGNMAAVKITNARLLEAEQARLRMAQELATAARIQRQLLPEAPEIAGYACDVRVEPCHEVGGDLYDFYARPDGCVLFVVGDVSGKGMGASLLMSSVMTSARVLYAECEDLAQMASRLNTVIHRSTESGHFVTMFLGALTPSSGRLHYVNAGHNAPILVRRGERIELKATGVPIGILPDFTYEAGSIALESGDLLAVFSDGIPEAARGDEFYDQERFEESLLGHASEPQLAAFGDRVIARVDEFLAGSPRTDDVTLLLLRRE